MLQAAAKSSDAPPPTIGARIAAARMRKGWGQKETAEKLGVHEATYRRWELNQTAVKTEYHEKLVRVLKMQFTDFNPY